MGAYAAAKSRLFDTPGLQVAVLNLAMSSACGSRSGSPPAVYARSL